MNTQESGRIEAIRSKATTEKKSVSELDRKISDAYLKQQLKLATNFLDDIETFFIRHAQEAKSAGHIAMWLNQAEITISIASQKRQMVQQIVDTYGPDAISSP